MIEEQLDLQTFRGKKKVGKLFSILKIQFARNELRFRQKRLELKAFFCPILKNLSKFLSRK